MGDSLGRPRRPHQRRVGPPPPPPERPAGATSVTLFFEDGSRVALPWGETLERMARDLLRRTPH